MGTKKEKTPTSASDALADAAMAQPRKHDSTNGATLGERSDKDESDNPIDPRAFGLAKAAYGVGETLDLLSIGRTSLYAAVKRGDLKHVKFGKKTLFYATDLAEFLARLRRLSEADAHRVDHAPSASNSTKRS
jgi:excisionase family DNA binding protein